MWKEMLLPCLALVSVGAVPVGQSLEAITAKKDICRLQTMLQKWWGGIPTTTGAIQLGYFYKYLLTFNEDDSLVFFS